MKTKTPWPLRRESAIVGPYRANCFTEGKRWRGHECYATMGQALKEMVGYHDARCTQHGDILTIEDAQGITVARMDWEGVVGIGGVNLCLHSDTTG